MTPKKWRNEIEKHISRWESRLANRRWWPRFVYFYTDISNIPNILREGRLYSRTVALQKGIVNRDCACQNIITNTNPEHIRYVRLYFRPRTPTQYRNEGIRPKAEVWNDAHCPVPVFLLFDALSTLSHDNAEFSNISLASPYAKHGSTLNDFHDIDFDKVFHEGRYDPDTDGDISKHRHAEVLIPQHLEIHPHLRYIACRSQAERDTLIYLLEQLDEIQILQYWQQRIRIGNSRMFEKRWAFVNTVDTNGSELRINFNRSTQHVTLFNGQLTLQLDDSQPYVFNQQIPANNTLIYIIDGSHNTLFLEILLDDCLAYRNIISLNDIIL